MATKSPSTNTSTSTNRCTISTKSCRKSTTSKPRPKGFLNKSSILGIHPYLGSGVALQHFLFGVRSRIATFSQQSTTEDRRKTTVFEARCCIATFSPVSPVGGTGRKIASGKYRKPYAGRDQRPETRDQRPETRDQRPETRDQRPETRDQRPETKERRGTPVGFGSPTGRPLSSLGKPVATIQSSFPPISVTPRCFLQLDIKA